LCSGGWEVDVFSALFFLLVFFLLVFFEGIKGKEESEGFLQDVRWHKFLYCIETIQITEYLMAADAHIVNSAEKIDQVHKRLLVLIIHLAILQYSKFSGSLCSVPSGY
jgi:hypothetical protein